MKTAMTSTVAALALMSGPALADLTPDELWQSWVDYYQSMGMTLSEGSRDSAGTTTTLRDVTMTIEDGAANVHVQIPVIEMQQTGDGNVRVTFDQPIRMRSETEVPANAAENADGTTETTTAPLVTEASAEMPGAELLASGTPDNITYDLRAPTTTLRLDRMESEGEVAENPAEATLTNMVMAYTQQRGETTATTQKGTIERAEFGARAVGKDNSGSFDLTGSVANISLDGNSTMPLDVAQGTDLNTLLKAGMEVVGQFAFGDASMVVNFAQPDETGAMQSGELTSSSTSSTVALAMSDEGFSYSGGYEGLQTRVTGPGLPAPLSFTSASGAFDIAGPVMKSDTPQPYKFSYSLGQLTLAEGVWAMFDPQGILSRDPADLDIDLSGDAKVNVDVFDAANMQANTTPEPIQPLSLNINRFDIKALGAAVAAKGALTLSETMGMQEPPVGTLNARYEGLEELLGKLAQAGLIPQDQLTGARMMLMMFAKPGDTPGVLTTDLEFREGGSIFANGQQVR